MTPSRILATIAATLIALIGSGPEVAAGSGSASGPPAAPTTAPFLQCPAVFLDASCGYLIDITNAGNKVLVDPTVSYYEGSDDVLVGVQNDSSGPVSTIHAGIAGSGFGTFEFDGDGLCNPGGQPTPADCPFGPIAPNNPGAGGDYFGPDATLAVDPNPCPGNTIGTCTDDGTVSFSRPLQSGQYTYFSLEAPFTGATVVAGTQNDAIRTTLNDGTNSGVHLVGPSPTAITDTASVLPSSINNATPGGSVTYSVYSDAACTTKVADGGTVAINSGSAASQPFGASLPNNAIYYVQATYTGDANYNATTTNCGDATVTFGKAPVKPRATITTSLVGSTGATGALLTVPTGTTVHDTASVTANGSAQSGRITYYMYSNSSCTTQVPRANLGSGAAVNGTYPPSLSVKLANGTYYLKATYSGNATYAPGVTRCGAEVLSVKTPMLTASSVSPSTFKLTGRKVNGQCVKQTAQNNNNMRCTRAIKLRITYSLTAPATVTFTVKLLLPGRKVSGQCVKPTVQNNKHQHCTLRKNVHGAINRTGAAGANTFSFMGKIGGHSLGPGTYQLIATTARGSRSAMFRITG